MLWMFCFNVNTAVVVVVVVRETQTESVPAVHGVRSLVHPLPHSSSPITQTHPEKFRNTLIGHEVLDKDQVSTINILKSVFTQMTL